ncbi:MAG TPA: XdhC family protein, partial [Ferruginibacter sp.]|nr:XdhC family protein [Ferruginibacter sp.]
MDVWHFIHEKLEAAVPVMLMYVLESEGSSPGRQGFKMAVAFDGTFCGTIGGGIMEHKLVEKSKQMLIDGATGIELKQQYHDKEQGSDQSGMICSGSQLNAFIPVSANDKPIIDYIIEGQQKAFQITQHGFALVDAAADAANIEFQFKDEQ